MFLEFSANGFNLVVLDLHQIEKVSVDYINWNTVGSFIIVVFPIIFSFLFAAKKSLIRFIIIFCLTIISFGLFITNSRAAILGVVLSLVFVLYHLKRQAVKIVFIVLLFFIPLLFISSVSEYLDIYFRLDRLTSGRDVIWSTITDVILDNPILGYGPAASKYAFYNHLTVLLGSPEEKLLSYHYSEIEFGHAHNFYLFFWSDLGLLGLFTSLFLPYTFFRLGFLKLKFLQHINSEYFYLNLGIIAAGIGLFVRGVFEWSSLVSYGTITLDLPFWILLALLCYINNKENNLNEKILVWENKMV
jgi:O-antigen ligase